MLDERSYEKGGWKKWLKIILLSAVAVVLIFLLIKTFYLNGPKLSPDETAVFYLKAEQNFERETAEKYLFEKLEEVEILGEKYQNLSKIRWAKKEKEGEEPVFAVMTQKIEKRKAIIGISEKTNKKAGLPFFDYFLPEEIIFDVWLEKVGDWKKGYQWQLLKINSADLVLKKKLGEKAEISAGLFIRPIKLEEYLPENLKMPEGIKIISLEIEYENNSNKPIRINPFGEWRIVDAEGKVFNPASLTSALFLRQPVLLGKELELGETKRGYVMFETQNEVSAAKIIFKNMEKKIIFEM